MQTPIVQIDEPLIRKRGDTYPVEMVLLDSITKIPIDITGYTFDFAVNVDPTPRTDANHLFKLTGTVIGDPKTGTVHFAPSTANVNHIGTYFFEAQLTDADGYIRTFSEGTFILVQDMVK